MKKLLGTCVVILFVVMSSSSAGALVLYETNFDDGNLADWIYPVGPGPWAVQDGALTADLRTVGGVIQLTGVDLPDSFVLEFDTRTFLLGYDDGTTAYFAVYTHFYNLNNLLGHGYQPNRVYIDDHTVLGALSDIDPSEWHHMKFIENGLQHSLYFDDRLIYDVLIENHPTGGAFAINLGGLNAIHQWDNLIITVPEPASLPVTIDIKPNSINPKSKGKIEVAILSTKEFNAPEMVDIESLTFGRTGDEDSLAFCENKPKKVNHDKLKDLVCHFCTQDTGFQCGDTEGILKGMTVDGRPIEGSDSVKIIPCKKK